MEEPGLETTTRKPHWCLHRTEMRASLVFLCMLSAALAVALMIVLTIKIDGGSKDKDDLCLSEDCVKGAARLMDAINKNVDPCDNFYDYACGSWERLNTIPADRLSYSTFEKLRDQLLERLKDLLETEIKPDENSAIKKAKYMYSACINTSLIEEQGLEPVKEFMEFLGGWPVTQMNWDSSTFNLYELMSKLRILNNHIFVYMWVATDERDSATNIIQIDQGDLGMPTTDHYILKQNANKLNFYKEFAMKVAITLGANKTVAEQDMSDVINLEVQIANISVPREARRDIEKVYKKMTLGELMQKIPDFDWNEYFSKTFASVNITLTMDEPIGIHALDYMVNLVKILSNAPKRLLANYLVWRIMMNRVNNLPEKYKAMMEEYQKKVFGKQADTPRWRDCMMFTKENMGNAVGRLFIEKYFDEEAKENANEMIHNIRNAFNELLREVEWMDQKTLIVAEEKANAIVERIGYPAYILNETILANMYDHVEYYPDTYFTNVITAIKWSGMMNLKQLRQPVDSEEWLTPPVVVNAFYSTPKNQIFFPAGILQPPFYSKGYPKSLNYGGIGMVIGHEITHGFDDKGRQYDKDGDLKQWWDDDVIQRFKNQTQCIVDQYSNYIIPEAEMNLNGILTQGENIADNGGLKQAYRAYKKWEAKQNRKERSLPGLSQFTHDQLFFLNFAQVWCGSMRREAAINRIQTATHSPGRFRVIGTLQNSYEFAKVFNCKPGTYMNPVKKCVVW